MGNCRLGCLVAMAIAGGWLAVGAARADTAGDAVLSAVDAALNRAKTQYIEYDVINREQGKNERRLAETVRINGKFRRTEFTAPEDMKGLKVLILSPTQMYVYLPAFGKIRRITSHTSDRSFLGMAFSQDDFPAAYGSDYNASIGSATPTRYELVLVPKTSGAPPYARIEMTVDRDKMLPTGGEIRGQSPD